MFQPFPFHFEGGGGSEYSGKIDCVFPESGGGRVRRGGKKSYQNSGKNNLLPCLFRFAGLCNAMLSMYACFDSLASSSSLLSTGLHRALGNPRKPKNFTYFPNCFLYFWDCGSNIKVFGQNNLIVDLLRQK